MKTRFIAILLAVWFTQCDGTGTTDSGGGGGGDGSGQPTLTDADFDQVSPCSDRDTLPDDATFVATVQAATAVKHIHTQYDGDATLGAVCGKEGDWDPESPNEIVATNDFDATVSGFIEAHFQGVNMTQICRSTFGFVDTVSPDDDALGFPEATTYRGDGCVESGSDAYSFRTRVTVSGDSADAKFADLGIDDAGDLALFDADGSQLVSADDGKSTVTADPGDFTFTVRSADGNTTHLTVEVEVICVKKLAAGESCPADT